MNSLNGAEVVRSSGLTAVYTITGSGLSGGAAFFYLKPSLALADDDASTIRRGSADGLEGVTVSATSTAATITVTIPASLLPTIPAGRNTTPMFFELKYRPVTGLPDSLDKGRLNIVRTAIATVPS